MAGVTQVWCSSSNVVTIRSCHDCMTAVVRVSNGTTGNFNIRNEDKLWHYFLFNFYFAAMVAYWRVWVTVRYNIGRKLVGDITIK